MTEDIFIPCEYETNQREWKKGHIIGYEDDGRIKVKPTWSGVTYLSIFPRFVKVKEERCLKRNGK